MIKFQEIINFNEVVDFLHKSTNLKFRTFYRDGSYSPGVHFKGILSKDEFSELMLIVENLINIYKYQLIFSIVDGNLIKFNFDNLRYFSSQNKLKFDIELYTQPTTKVKINNITEYTPNGILFHGTNIENVDSILKYGLLPKGRDQLNGYKYPPTNHFLIRLNGMIELVNGKLKGASKWKDNLVIFKLVNPSKYKFLLDPACDVGCITYQKISSSDLVIIDESEYKELFSKYSDKNYRPFEDNKFKLI